MADVSGLGYRQEVTHQSNQQQAINNEWNAKEHWCIIDRQKENKEECGSHWATKVQKARQKQAKREEEGFSQICSLG